MDSIKTTDCCLRVFYKFWKFYKTFIYVEYPKKSEKFEKPGKDKKFPYEKILVNLNFLYLEIWHG